MKLRGAFLIIALVIAATNSLLGQSTNCQAYFTYSYQPWLTQPEEDIYIFSDSSTGEDATTSYNWSFGTGDFSAIQNPSYTYDLDDSVFEPVCLIIHNADNGCQSQYCDTLKLDDLCIGARFTYVQQGDTFIFETSICGQLDSISWDFGDGTTLNSGDTVMHVFSTAVDSYYVCMHAFLNPICQYFLPCKAIDCHEIYVDPTGIIHVATEADGLKIYPNPAGNNISIIADNAEFPEQVYVTDITGNVLLNKTVVSNTEQLSISDLAPGIYLAQVTSARHQKKIARFAKQ